MSSVFVCHCHDPVNQGASTEHGLTEWMISCVVCDEIKRELRLNRVRPIYLNQTLEDRVRKINIMCAEDRKKHFVEDPHVAVEVHCNWSDEPQREGFFVMAHHCSVHGIRAASSVAMAIGKLRPHARNMGVNMVSKNRQWINTRYEYETNRQFFIHATTCPAILVEACFLSNPAEAKWIAERDNQERLGKSIGQGLVRYLKKEARR